MKVEKITVEFLKNLGACEEGIKFFEINKLEGFPVSLIKYVEGDYDEFVYFVMGIINSEYEFDTNDNIISKIDSCGIETKYGYDEMGNKIIEKGYNGNEYKWEYKYDQKGNIILVKDFTGWECEYLYDDNGNLIHTKDSNGKEYSYEYLYDDKTNIIWEKDCNGKEYRWEYRYDENVNKIYEKDKYGRICEYRYDENGNVIWKKDCNRKESNYEVEYYSDGQLKRYRNLYIPWFEKS